jgi:hypothetical protein
MRTAEKRGTVLTLVIVLLSLMGLVMLVLTEGANTMLFQADAAYCQAVQRNLTASALAWGRSQTSQGSAVAASDPVELDSRFLGECRVALTVRFTRISDAAADIHVETSCSKGRQMLRESHDHSIPLR